MSSTNNHFEPIVRAFQSRYGLVVGVARRYAPTPDLVYDIAQQAFIDFFEGAIKGNWDLEQDVRPILYTITKNRALKFGRRRKQDSSEVLQLVWERLMSLTRENQDAMSDEGEELEKEVQILNQCVNKLPEKSRRYIEQHYFDGIAIKDIAQQETMDAGVLRQAFCRIRAKLRDCVEKTLKSDLEQGS